MAFKQQGRPILADKDKKHQVGGRVSWEAFCYIRDTITEPAGTFIDRCILAFIAAQKPVTKVGLKQTKKIDKPKG